MVRAPQDKIRRGGWDVLGGDFVLRDPNPLVKSEQIASDITWLSHVV